VDGRSFLPLLTKTRPAWGRTAFMIERRGGRNTQEELGDGGDMKNPNSFNAIRTAKYTYVEYGNGDTELYDLAADPDELVNIAKRIDPDVVRRLSARLGKLAKCAASTCRIAEDTPE
jgi:N-acetylglucosamine-6-sulfatase